jgi:hypothetical protein
MPVTDDGILFTSATLLQKGEAIIVYQYRKDISAYLIASILCAPNTSARIDLTKALMYFFNNIVKGRDAYCSLFLDGITDIFPGQLEYSKELNGLSIFKIDNSKFTNSMGEN